MITPLLSLTMQLDSGKDMLQIHKTGSFTSGQGYAMATTTGSTVALLVLCKQQIKASILSITMV